MGLKPILTYVTGIKPPEDLSEDEVDPRYQYTSRSSRLQEDGEARINRSSTTGRHTVGGAPPPEAIPAHAHDDLEEWFPLGLTYALVVRKHRGLGRQI
jgi:hypothetical protein